MKSQISDPVPSKLCEDVKAEASDEETLEETLEVSGMKKEETLELKIDIYEDDLNNTPEDISVKEEDPDTKDYLYCEVCKSIFFNKCEVHGPPLFFPDTPAPMGITDRARQTLPPGLEIQKSGIPNAGLGVFNKGETVPVGAHFGPYQGEMVDREEAMNSGYSWVICRDRQGEVYMDAKRETYANWMRFVNCARDDEEQNLVAFQYQGGILYRCCRPINPGQELLVWYEEKYAKELSPAFDQLWNRKCSTNEINNAQVQDFSCSTCPLSYSSQIYLDKHIQRCHYEENVRLQEPEEVKYEIQVISKDSCSQPSSSDVLSSDTHKRIKRTIHHCTACGKNFGHQDTLKTHQCSQAGEKPHCCSQCGKRFSKRINLHKHQRIHTGKKPHQCSQCGKSFTLPSAVLVHQRIHTGEKPYHCSQCGPIPSSFVIRQLQQPHHHVMPPKGKVRGKAKKSSSHPQLSPVSPAYMVLEEESETNPADNEPASGTPAPKATKKARAPALALKPEQEQEVVDWYRENEFLYNFKMADFKNREKRSRVVSEKAQQLGVTADQLTTWVKSMRDRTGKLTKKQLSGSGRLPMTDRGKWILENFGYIQNFMKRVAEGKRKKRGQLSQKPSSRARPSTRSADVAVTSPAVDSNEDDSIVSKRSTQAKKKAPVQLSSLPTAAALSK
ncbi:histone-lysine N-methyltransferase PRDM9-like, partial [Clarias magur]